MMKTLKNLLYGLLAVCAMPAFAQTDKATTAKLVADSTYTFVASSATALNARDIAAVMNQFPGATPTSGTIHLTGGHYEVKVTPDSVIAFLPYYGRSFTAPIHTNEGGVKFTSTKFDYQSGKGKKRGWDIAIDPQDTSEGYRLILSVGDEGYATLTLNSHNKQSITYRGYLRENSKK